MHTFWHFTGACIGRVKAFSKLKNSNAFETIFRSFMNRVVLDLPKTLNTAGTANDNNNPMITTAIIISTRVNPLFLFISPRRFKLKVIGISTKQELG